MLDVVKLIHSIKVTFLSIHRTQSLKVKDLRVTLTSFAFTFKCYDTRISEY